MMLDAMARRSQMLPSDQMGSMTQPSYAPAPPVPPPMQAPPAAMPSAAPQVTQPLQGMPKQQIKAIHFHPAPEQPQMMWGR